MTEAISTSLDERETTFTVEATDRNTLHVFSNDKVWQDRLRKLGIEATSQDGYGSIYTIDLSNFNFSLRKRRKLTEEQRLALRKQLASGMDSDDDSDDATG